MSTKLTIEWLREMIDHQMAEYKKSNSMLLESPHDDEDIDLEVGGTSSDLSWPEMIELLNGEGTANELVIMTPENPLNWKGADEYDRNKPYGLKKRNMENDSRRKVFEAKLKEDGFQAYKIAGKYNVPENSYIIPGMSKAEAVELGKEYGQDSVIYADKQSHSQGNYMQYQMIYTSRGEDYDSEAGLRYVTVAGPEADVRKDLYSSYNGVKFFIPFYDPKYEDIYPWDLDDSEDLTLNTQQEEVPIE